ncbi:MAG: hypothetical protein DI535_04715 [Citrobacter freundii]|nr:MAG: hypothetical protein DI535_04715 [Citrobacter freundii]
MANFEFKRLDTLDNLELFSSENENDYFPFHFHDYYCVSLITNGTELLRNTQQEFVAPSGTISITQANEVHRNYSLSETGYSYKTLYVNPDVLTYFNHGHRVAALDRVIDDPRLFQQLLEIFRGGSTRSLAGLVSHATLPYEASTIERNFGLIDEMIESRPAQVIDNAWLAKQFHISPFHFIRLFKKARGITPQAYIMLFRLRQTKELLLKDMPIAHIAYQFGFHDPSHFTHQFRKYFGVTPSQFKLAK